MQYRNCVLRIPFHITRWPVTALQHHISHNLAVNVTFEQESQKKSMTVPWLLWIAVQKVCYSIKGEGNPTEMRWIHECGGLFFCDTCFNDTKPFFGKIFIWQERLALRLHVLQPWSMSFNKISRRRNIFRLGNKHKAKKCIVCGASLVAGLMATCG